MKCHVLSCGPLRRPALRPFHRGPAVPLPACRGSTASRSPPSVRAAAGRAVRRDPASRVSRARPRASAPARFARLIAPAREVDAGRTSPARSAGVFSHRCQAKRPPDTASSRPISAMDSWMSRSNTEHFSNFFAPTPPFTAARLPGPATAVILARRFRSSAITADPVLPKLPANAETMARNKDERRTSRHRLLLRYGTYRPTSNRALPDS